MFATVLYHYFIESGYSLNKSLVLWQKVQIHILVLVVSSGSVLAKRFICHTGLQTAVNVYVIISYTIVVGNVSKHYGRDIHDTHGTK